MGYGTATISNAWATEPSPRWRLPRYRTPEERLKVYPLATGPREHTAINVSGMGTNTLPPEDGSVYAMLDEIIQYEPTELFDKELLGRLATLGIEKGKPFKPDARMKRIFDQAAKQGVAMSRAIVYASRDPEINYWPGCTGRRCSFATPSS